MESVAVSAASWAVGKALSLLSGGLLEAWGATNNLGSNIEAIKTELLFAQSMLNGARDKEINDPALTELLQQLQDLAYGAEDVLNELDYFRIQDELDGTYEAADEHAGGCLPNLGLNARHAAGNWLQFCSCAAKPKEGARPQVVLGGPSQPPAQRATEEARGRIRRLSSAVGKHLPCYSSPPVRGDDNSGMSTPKLKFDRVSTSERMKNIANQLKHLRRLEDKVASCTPRVIDRTQRNTKPSSIESKLHGRDDTRKKILKDIRGEFSKQDLTVLPIVGPGGIGKTTLIQYIYEDLQNDFDVRIWICVSLNFNVNTLTKEILGRLPQVKDEKNGSEEELIEQRLKSKRFLLVLDDVWKCHQDDWKTLLVPFRKGGSKGNMVLVTTRSGETAKMVKTTNQPINLVGLKAKEFMQYFEACVFGDKEEPWKDHNDLLGIGQEIVIKLKGFPLAAKTVGRLLRGRLNSHYWTGVLESKKWELQTDDRDIMPALMLSYDYLPFHLQQCFSNCALFREDYRFDREELIHLWIGLDILQSDPNIRIEDVGSDYLDALVNSGFLDKHEDDGRLCYVIHDLFHNLAVKVSSRECLCIDRIDAKSVEVPQSIRHLSIIMRDVHRGDGMTKRDFINELCKPEGLLNVVVNLRTLMLFGEYDETFDDAFGKLFREATSLRVLRLPTISNSVDHILPNFSKLVHLRYLRLKSKPGINLPGTLSRYYHLVILDLKEWRGYSTLPDDMTNLKKLCHFCVQDDKLHSSISEVGKLRFLQELKRFEVKKQSNGFELTELGQLMKLKELGIFNLENALESEADKAKLKDRAYLCKLTLCWDSERAINPYVEANVLEKLKPHNNLLELSVIGHGGHFGPKWLHDNLSTKSLESLHLDGVFWKVLPPLLTESKSGHVLAEDQIFQKLRFLTIKNGHELLELPFSFGQDGNMTCFPVLKKLVITDCRKLSSLPPIPWTTTLCDVLIEDVGSSLNKLAYKNIPSLVSLSIKGEEFKLGKELPYNLGKEVLVCQNLTNLQQLDIFRCRVSGKELTQLLSHLCVLSELTILHCKRREIREEEEEEGLLRFPHVLSGTLRKLAILSCPDLKVVDLCPYGVEGMTTLAPISNLTSLTELRLRSCGKDQRVEGLETLLTRGHLTTFRVHQSPKFFVGWEPRGSSKLQVLDTDDLAVLAEPICSFLSSSLTTLELVMVERFTREQEDALQLLTSLQDLQFWSCMSLPAGLDKFRNLKRLQLIFCRANRPLPVLPESLKILVARDCSDELKQHCRKLEGTIPQISIY